MERFAGIQVARAIAALSVAYYHSKYVLAVFPEKTDYPIGYVTQNGFYGVDLFFAISGFVLCVVASKPSFDRIGFLIKRAFRIYPLWIVCCFVYWWTVSHFAVKDAEHAIASFLLLPTSSYPLLDSGWTLQHEIAFYLLAALLIPLVRLPGLAAFMVAAFVASHFVELPWWATYLIRFYPMFLAGMIGYWLAPRLAGIGWVLPLALGCFAFWTCTTYLAEPRNGLPVALLLLIVGFTNMAVARPWRWVVLLGDASYSIYLIHSVVVSWLYKASLHIPVPPIWTQEFIRYGALAAICMISIWAWRYFETPINAFGHRLAARASARFTGFAPEPAAANESKS